MNAGHPGGGNQGRRRAAQGRPIPQPMFPDPFGGLMGQMGMGMGGSLFDEFFSRSPFDDPFFSRPFGSMFGSTGGLFGPSGLMGSMAMLENGGLFSRPSYTGFGEQRPAVSTLPQREGRRGPVIEELPDDDDEAVSGVKPQHSQQPIIEHPDDESPVEHEPQQRRQLQSSRSLVQSSQGAHVNNGNAFEPSSQFQSFSFQTSSVSYGGGVGGTYYASSSSQRVGADGVMEEEHAQRDSSGRETKSIARGYCDKVHAITKKREANGPENILETLHNLTPEEAPEFDVQWETCAQRSLPGWRHSRSQMLETSSSRLDHPAVQALPYATEGNSGGSLLPRKHQRI